MNNYELATHKQLGHHSNAFIDQNGIPYLLAEYIDRRCIQQIDRSMIRSEILIDKSEAMRAVVDIRIDDIGKRASDGLPAVEGNNTKRHKLLEMINLNSDRYDHQLPVLRRGIIVRVNYQLESYETGHVIRSMSEDLRIKDRNYFLDNNPRNIDDNAIIINFWDTIVSTVNEFTHGRSQMSLRITNVQMFYECLRYDRKMHNCSHMMSNCFEDGYLPTTYGTEQDMYHYHMQHQNNHFIYGQSCGHECPDTITPPGWTGYNRFYHFDHCGSDIILHSEEINDPNCATVLVPAGKVTVNRTFMINPGHRIVFRFSIWKNDLTIVNDTAPIAVALKAPIYGGEHQYHHDDCFHDDHHCGEPINLDHETLIRLYREIQCVNDRQNAVINSVMLRLDDLTDKVNSLLPPVENPPENPDTPPVVDPEPTPDPETPVDPPVEPEVPPVEGGDGKPVIPPEEPSTNKI